MKSSEAVENPMSGTADERILILAPTGRDAEMTARVLREAGLSAEICTDVPEICLKLSQNAGAIFLAGEALTAENLPCLLDALAAQETWSDIPLIVLTSGGGDIPANEQMLTNLSEIGNVTLIERPVRLMTLMSAIKSSLRARRRQYDIRDYIAEEKRTADELAQLYESELAARAEAQAANRLKDDFLATVSHELRTPLNAMLGWVTLLKTGNLDAEAAERALTVIERNARSQAQIIEDLLDVSRIITGRLTLNVQSFNIVQLIETVIQSIQPSVAAKNITVTPHISEDVGLISADSARIQQILWNLLTNAVKFTPNDGQIEISARREDAMLSISVKDTGKGIAPAFLPFVFDRFRQAESSTTRRFGGLGLGLAIVRHLVELHGGTVSVESRGEGQGAIFTIKIPLVQPQQPLIEAETNGAARPENSGTSAPVSLNGLNILIVDDEADAREMVKMFLENSGANVTAANSVTEALEKLQRKVPDLIISDIGMPDINGYQFIEKVRSLPPENGGTVPAVALTAYSRGEDVKRALRAGYQKHIAKPIEMNKLAVTVADAVGRV